MNPHTAKYSSLVVVLLILFSLPSAARAQGKAALTGTVSASASGQTLGNVRILAKDSRNGAVFTASSDAGGHYAFRDLEPGDYVVTVDADGFTTKSESITLRAGQSQTLDLRLEPLPNAPSAAPGTPSLSDLGFSSSETKSDPHLQALLSKRTEMLRIHQRLGLITTIPMAAAVITGPMAKAKGRNGQTIKEPTQANLDTHIALGGATTALYFSTAYFAMFAPRVPGTEKHGAIRWHEALAWIHGPGMILTPALGVLAYKQENAGEKVHGIASAHGAVAYITAASYGTAIVAVSWPIHVKFWEKH